MSDEIEKITSLLKDARRENAPDWLWEGIEEKIKSYKNFRFEKLQTKRTLIMLRYLIPIVSVIRITSIFLIYRYSSKGYNSISNKLEDSSVSVLFTFQSASAREIALAGDFNRWDTQSIRLKRIEGDIWEARVYLSPGRYTYCFIIDGKEWLPDPHSDYIIDDGFGGRNSVIIVKETKI